MKLFLNDKFILLVIVINAIVIFISGFEIDTIVDERLTWLDNFISLLFTIELAYKFKIFGKTFFKSSWNKFDFILVVLSLPSFFASLIPIDLGYLLVFRILRIFKVFRVFKFLPEVDHIIAGINRAMRASIFVLIGFVIYIFITGILSFYLFKGTGSFYFENPLAGLYSTFKIFTIEGWFEIPDDVTEHLSPLPTLFTNIYFIFIVMSGGIFGLSLVNSIFVDAMVSDNNEGLEKKILSLENKIDILLRDREAKR
jgi:voltage-gated sodium channel